jgi:hypothetical protein
MAKSRGIITPTQDAITDAANSAAKAVTGAALTAVRGARRIVGPAKKRKTAKRRSKARKAVKRKVGKRRPAKNSARKAVRRKKK